MPRCSTMALGALLAACAAIAVPLASKYAALAPDQPFSVMSEHNATVQPELYISRLRTEEVQRQPDQEFFQWWNFLVFDAETRDHFNIYYGLHLPSADGTSGAPAYGKVAIAHLRGAKTVTGAKDIMPMARVRTSGQFDVEFLGEDGKVLHSLRAVDDDTYRLVGRIDGDGISWDLTVRRVSGYYGALDTEDPTQCLMTSTLFGYHSAVEGAVQSAGQRYQVERTPQFRAYAAGSWGCALPTGEPPIEYPWTWFWLVLPGETEAEDLGLCGGTGRFSLPIGPMEGGYACAGGVPDTDGGPGRHHYSTRYARLFHQTQAELLLQASASDGHFVAYDVEQDDWATFRDEAGEALVPLRQTFRFSSAEHDFVVDFRPTLEQYFRAPVVFREQLFSDFRAVGARTHVVITARGSGAVLLDKWVDTMNAVEYAYVTPSTPELREQHK